METLKPRKPRYRKSIVILLTFLFSHPLWAQDKVADFVRQVTKEETENSQLQGLGHELFDSIGPRLVGSPGMEKAPNLHRGES